MAVHELTFETIMKNLDGGRVAMAFQQHVQRVVQDCENRPGDDKERKVTLEFKCYPIADDHGTCEEVKGKFHVTSTVPKQRSKEYSFGVRKSQKGLQLVFNDLSDGDIKQGTFDEMDE
ncbi:MAG: hypothetical protein R3C03_24110 [Pirellulaceae bacterium]